ncbi:hypothetical protein I316_08002 [Kwoniella heveanensis BCC8398]|uniref:Uncharacterized protein n=1 Tax=Kwoniella heveanensis BCC8398 TaxID=1296120 RepID=A0A1B9GH68_9TREE|nr:hypothetical protein I316_08002 [Kwoniella heveanensis BCC8398]
MRLLTILATLGATSAAILPKFEALARRQSPASSSSMTIPEGYTTTLITTSIFRNGPQDSTGSSESTIPFACLDGCWTVAGPYFFCFVNTTTPNGNHTDPDECNKQFCNATVYEHFSQCLNCIIANGEERPFGYHTNSSHTVANTPLGGPLAAVSNPNGLIDLEQANQMLKNVTDRCQNIGQALSSVTSSITATPTTTGPYYTSWTSSATLDLPTWTGLSKWASEAVQTYVATVPIETGSTSSGSTGAADASSSTAGSGGNSAGSALKVGSTISVAMLAGAAWAVGDWMSQLVG